MKKSSFFIAVSVMTLALVVAVVGITAAWFGDTYDYRDGPINVSSANPKNNAIIVPGSSSELPTGESAILAPARLKYGYGLSDVDGSGGYEDLDVLDSTHPALEKIATQVTVKFDFVYNGAPSNPDGTTTRMKIELVSVTLSNPLAEDLTGDGKMDSEDSAIFLETHTNYRDEFGVDMFVTTTNGEVMIFSNPQGEKYYTQKGEGVNAYYQLNDTYHYYETADGEIVENPDSGTKLNPHVLYFDVVPVTHTLNATIHFLKVDEETSPELIGAQLFLNFQVSFLTNENGNEN